MFLSLKVVRYLLFLIKIHNKSDTNQQRHDFDINIFPEGKIIYLSQKKHTSC